MTTYEKIRAALELAASIHDDRMPYAEEMRRDELVESAIATLAELELAAQTPAPVAEIREPTPEECERICTEYERLLMREGTCGGRDAFDAVRAVMWPKSEGL